MAGKILTKEQREQRAIETIIGCCLRGYGEDFWKKVFKKMDEMDAAEKAKIVAAPSGTQQRPLEVGNIYRFRGYAKNGFKIVGMSLPGTPSDDGGLPGVAVQWLNYGRERGWYVFHSETDFWNYLVFRNAEDPEACGYNKGDELPLAKPSNL
jgi:hypothetical protein